MKPPLLSYLLLGLFLLTLPSLAQQPEPSLFEAHLHIAGNDTLPYRLYRSEKSNTINEPLPLVIFLHGAGERGNDNIAQIKHIAHYFLDDTITGSYPFLLMAPQCPEGKRWVNTDWSLPEHQMESEPTATTQFSSLIPIWGMYVGIRPSPHWESSNGCLAFDKTAFEKIVLYIFTFPTPRIRASHQRAGRIA